MLQGMHYVRPHQLWRRMIQLFLNHEGRVSTEVPIFLQSHQRGMLMRREQLKINVGLGQ